VHQRAGDGDALALAAGELVRETAREAAHIDPLQGLERPLARARFAGQEQRQFHVFQSGQRGKKLEELEHEADFPPPQTRESGV
jgi:hypothetical protein